MSEHRSYIEIQSCGRATRLTGVYDKLFVVLVMLIVVRSGAAVAGDQTSTVGGSLKPPFNAGPAKAREPLALSAPILELPKTYQAAGVPDGTLSSVDDFRPRGRSVFDSEFQTGAGNGAPMLEGTTVWQRMADYRSHDRVRLLTLWESGGGSVSLQAGRKGEPSLQWNSRAMNRGGATRGVLDQWVSGSLASAGRSLHLTPHATAEEPAGRSSKLAEPASAATP